MITDIRFRLTLSLVDIFAKLRVLGWWYRLRLPDAAFALLLGLGRPVGRRMWRHVDAVAAVRGGAAGFKSL